MKITEKKLRQIIREEVERISERGGDELEMDSLPPRKIEKISRVHLQSVLRDMDANPPGAHDPRQEGLVGAVVEDLRGDSGIGYDKIKKIEFGRDGKYITRFENAHGWAVTADGVYNDLGKLITSTRGQI